MEVSYQVIVNIFSEVRPQFSQVALAPLFITKIRLSSYHSSLSLTLKALHTFVNVENNRNASC